MLARVTTNERGLDGDGNDIHGRRRRTRATADANHDGDGGDKCGP
jgi:hypothetical protein